jgi:hypothetical protein
MLVHTTDYSNDGSYNGPLLNAYDLTLVVSLTKPLNDCSLLQSIRFPAFTPNRLSALISKWRFSRHAAVHFWPSNGITRPVFPVRSEKIQL